MCGLFGAIGSKFNPAIIRALALANRERGSHSLGFFDSRASWIKLADDPLHCLRNRDFANWIDEACKGAWFVAGHTRHATTGRRTTTNAHPFTYGNIIGAHNGMVDYPYDRGYAVDSEYLFDQLHRNGGNYQTALSKIDGYWGLTWFDGEHFYIQAYENTVCIIKDVEGNWYYSSDGDHLAACIGFSVECRILRNGETVRFDSTGALVELTPFVSEAVGKWWDTSRTSGKGSSKSTVVTIVPTKRKSRKERKKERKDKYNGRLSYTMLDYADGLAQEAGYADLSNFMLVESINSERAALAFLEDCAGQPTHEPHDFYEVWEGYAAEDDKAEMEVLY